MDWRDEGVLLAHQRQRALAGADDGLAGDHEVGLMRAVENGFSMVRQVSSGASMAVDPWGRVLASQDHFRTADRLMIADVPTRRVQTLYGLLGDWFAYAGAALAVVLVVLAVARPAGRRDS